MSKVLKETKSCYGKKSQLKGKNWGNLNLRWGGNKKSKVVGIGLSLSHLGVPKGTHLLPSVAQPSGGDRADCSPSI